MVSIVLEVSTTVVFEKWSRKFCLEVGVTEKVLFKSGFEVRRMSVGREGGKGKNNLSKHINVI